MSDGAITDAAVPHSAERGSVLVVAGLFAVNGAFIALGLVAVSSLMILIRILGDKAVGAMMVADAC
jgi:hypothetical protein